MHQLKTPYLSPLEVWLPADERDSAAGRAGPGRPGNRSLYAGSACLRRRGIAAVIPQ
ncbi:hypothetical protein OBV_06250 [Oscillibacter valericigenes Sjm18-20]|nr:hypothetical protein OBV_06250 [Oscillibacter valericigenes Sjm18-20]